MRQRNFVDICPPARVLEWICRDNLDYLDLTEYRLELNPRH
jgi:hypothetical protein